jgi:hypothetical protein
MKTTIFSRPLPERALAPAWATASLEGLSLGWKSAVTLLALAAAAVRFYHTVRYESAGAWMYHFWMFALLTLLLFILIVIQASRTRRSPSGYTSLLGWRSLTALFSLVCLSGLWSALNWLLGWKLPVWFILLLMGAVESACLLISRFPTQESAPQVYPRRAALVAGACLLIALPGAVVVGIHAQGVLGRTLSVPDPHGYWAAPLRCGQTVNTHLDRRDYFYGRSYFDVYRFAVQPGTTYTLRVEPLYPLYAQLLVYPPGGAPTPPDSESAFSSTQSGDAWVSLFGISNSAGDEGTGLYRVSLECVPETP